jgi:hypothetical protein
MAVQQRRLVKSPRRQLLLADFKRTKSQLRQAVEEHGKTVKAELEAETADWSNQPEFLIRTTVSAAEIRVTVRPDRRTKAAKIFGYVDKGTKPHVIRPVRAKALRFKWGGPGSYRPKTAPAAKPLRLGSGAALETVFSQKVNHPGNEPRLISERIEQKTRPRFQRTVEATFRQMARSHKL